MRSIVFLLAATAGFTGVGLGAFGAHSFANILEANNRIDTYETATQYHLVHAAVLFGLATLTVHKHGRWYRAAVLSITTGIVLFSGSLYMLALFDLGFMGAVAPLGGTAFLIGWACIGMLGWQKPAT